MKIFFIITMIIASSLSFNSTMPIATKLDKSYYKNLSKRGDIDNDPRNSCPCPNNPMTSCPCDTIKNDRENIEESCSCSINDDHCNCIVLQRRSRVETEQMDKNSDLFLQHLWNKIVNDAGQSVTLYLLRKEN